MTETETPNHRYFREEVGEVAFIFLANLLNFNLDARRYMATATFNAIYKPLEERRGDLANLDDAARRQLLDLATLDILARVFMALEDLGKILLTTGKPLRDVPNVILGAGQADSLGAIGRFARRTEAEIRAAFPFIQPQEYGLEGVEAAGVERYYSGTVAVTRRMLAFLADFVDRHTWAYNKYKHGIPIILALYGQPLAQGIEGTMPIFTTAADLSKAKFILTGHLVAEKLIGLVGSVVGLSKTLIERRIQMAELGGLPPPLLCRATKVGQETKYESWGFGIFEKDIEQAFTSAFTKIMQQLHRTEIRATLNVQTDQVKTQNWVEFYTRDWRIS